MKEMKLSTAQEIAKLTGQLIQARETSEQYTDDLLAAQIQKDRALKESKAEMEKTIAEIMQNEKEKRLEILK